MSTTRQSEIGHSQGKVGKCPFCRKDRAELWCEPSEMPAGEPFQVRCFSCGAAGPWARNGWESAVPAWRMVIPRHPGPLSQSEEAKAPPSVKGGWL